MDLKSHIGLKIKAARQRKGMTQEQLACAVGKAVKTVSNIERGETYTGLETLLQIASVTEVAMTFFFEDLQDYADSDPRRSALKEDIVTLLRDLPLSDLRRVLRLVKALKE